MGMATLFKTRRPALFDCIAAGAALASLLAVAGIVNSPAAVADEFVAGTTPDRRPHNAPRINILKHTPAMRARALRGVSKPIPPSLRFVDDQGGWYTPFTRPNMPGRYDIRNLYTSAARSIAGRR